MGGENVTVVLRRTLSLAENKPSRVIEMQSRLLGSTVGHKTA